MYVCIYMTTINEKETMSLKERNESCMEGLGGEWEGKKGYNYMII